MGGRNQLYELLCPNLRVFCLQDIDLQELKRLGIRGIIFDLDNTIIPWDSEGMTAEVVVWLESLLADGLKVGLVSNNRRRRVREIASLFAIPYASRAYKPAKTGFRQVAAAMGLPATALAVVGDQLFTDMLGGNRLGMFTIWVTPLSAREFVGTKVTRQFEKIAVRILQAKGLLK
jgi:uncharacterized protein